MKRHLGRIRGPLAVWLLGVLSGTVTAHSWPERTIRLAPNGTMIGNPGFDRAHIDRATGPQDDYIIPPNGRPDGKVIHADDKIVKPTKMKLTDSSYTSQFPMLQVAPGDFVAIQYAENGHVTRADKTNPLKPVNRGTVYLYGTTQNDLTDVNLMDVHLKWTTDGKGGDGKGKLLATRNFDDGQCHEVVPADGDIEGISNYRKDHISETDSLLCQSDFQIPADTPVGQTLTVIWVWDWPDMNVAGVAVPPASYPDANSPCPQGDSAQPCVHIPEIYTGVVDYKIVDPCDDSLGEVKGPTCGNHNGKFAVQYAIQQAATTRGIPSQMVNPFLVQVPQAGFKVSTATAVSSNIPLHPLIGATATQFPLPTSILEAQLQFDAVPTATTIETAAPTPESSSSSTTPPTTSSAGAEPEVILVTVSITPAQSRVTVTVTAPARSSSAAGTGTTATAPPTVTRFLPSARAARLRRRYR
ncbi:hypothetical protein C8A03DRAFT_38548 [Achaetomium macrosporum]|uniref:DUF7492 domain-containing protein n=1 Tax=Achaetomium macrosporum TaxID=79813 RepID=A0AAN7C1P9_9PEZI|nr:hypothetical protein C8A03DRAFT_38548 [Achaetomium macrosporum]